MVVVVVVAGRTTPPRGDGVGRGDSLGDFAEDEEAEIIGDTSNKPLLPLYYLSRFTFRSVFYSLFFYRTLGKLEKKDGRLELRGNSRVVNGTPTPIRRHKTPEEAILQGQKQASGRSKAKAVSEVKKLSQVFRDAF